MSDWNTEAGASDWVDDTDNSTWQEPAAPGVEGFEGVQEGGRQSGVVKVSSLLTSSYPTSTPCLNDISAGTTRDSGSSSLMTDVIGQINCHHLYSMLLTSPAYSVTRPNAPLARASYRARKSLSSSKPMRRVAKRDKFRLKKPRLRRSQALVRQAQSRYSTTSILVFLLLLPVLTDSSSALVMEYRERVRLYWSRFWRAGVGLMNSKQPCSLLT